MMRHMHFICYKLFMYFVYFSTGYRNTSYNHKNNSFLRNKYQNFSQFDMPFEFSYAILLALVFPFDCFGFIGHADFSHYSIFTKLLFYYLLRFVTLYLDLHLPCISLKILLWFLLLLFGRRTFYYFYVQETQ